MNHKNDLEFIILMCSDLCDHNTKRQSLRGESRLILWFLLERWANGVLRIPVALFWSHWFPVSCPLRHPRCSPFKALRVLLVFEDPAEHWAQLMTLGGASSVRLFQADGDGSGTWSASRSTATRRRASLIRSVLSCLQSFPLASTTWW